MSVDNIPAAQDNTAPAEHTENVVNEVVEEVASEVKQDVKPVEDSVNPDTEKKQEIKLDMLLEDEPVEGEGYDLTFPDEAVADTEAVAVLNAIGKEFNITNEKAQALATAATEYGNRRVEGIIQQAKNSYAEFVNSETKKTKEFYGSNLKTSLNESSNGWRSLGVDLKSLAKDPNFQAITNVQWFIEAGRKINNLMNERPSITGKKTSGVERDLW